MIRVSTLPRSKLNANSALALEVELIASESREEITLTDARVSD